MVMHALMRSRASVPVFAERIFEPLPRTDQRRWAHTYVQSLLSTEGKKSVRRLAATVSDSPTASQSLHQFVNASPWEWAPVREELARWSEQRLEPQAWVVDLAVLRKRGEHSCGVHRRFVPASGRSVTCQVGVGAFLATANEAVPADWRLLLPGAWLKDEERRARTRIPDEVGPRPIERLALDLVDGLTDTVRTTAVPVVADLSAESGAGALARGLSLRGRDFVLAVPGRLQVMVGRHLRAAPQYGATDPGLVLEARNLFEIESGGPVRIETVAPGPGQTRPTTVLTSFVRLPDGRTAGPAPQRTYRLFAVRPEGRKPARLWLTSMTHARMESLLALTRLTTRTAQSLRQLEDDFGLGDFEGRSYPGWHHHMTLVSAAYAYSRLHGVDGAGEFGLTAA